MSKENKIMTTKEAISRFVKDGDSLICGNYSSSLPYSLIHEVIRQKKRHLTYYCQSGAGDADYLVAGDCVDKLITAFQTKWGGRDAGSMVERYQRAGKLQVEDYTNFTYNARLAAGAYGYSFMPVFPSLLDSDVFKVRDFMGENKFKVIKCPFTGKDIPVVPAANPDVAIVHVHRCDANGNAQHWGGIGSTAQACLASRKIIVTCEEIVDSDVIRSSPHLTIIPGFRVDAVIEEPYGCHPFELVGYRNFDIAMYSVFNKAVTSDEGLASIFDEWIYGVPDRAAYIKHYIDVFGQHTLDSFKAKSYYSAPANYGIAFSSGWDSKGKSVKLGINFEELEKIIEEKGELVDVK